MPNINAKTYEASSAYSVTFLGLGVMGYPMAGHLANAGHQVTVYNRTAAKAQAWVAEHGGELASTPREAAHGAQIVITCVGNDDDLRQVTCGPQGAFQSMLPGSVLVDHTTTSAEVAHELAQVAGDAGMYFIDAPVSGGNLGAINGVLTVMCGGDQAAFDMTQPVVSAYARAVTLLGGSGSGQIKLHFRIFSDDDNKPNKKPDAEPDARAAEVGFGKVELTALGHGHPMTAGLPRSFKMMQWHHAEVTKLPEGAEVLASSPITKVQIMRVGECLLGTQFHGELTPELVSRWAHIPQYIEWLEAALGAGAYQRVRAQALPLMPNMRQASRAMFDAVVAKKRVSLAA